MKPILFNTDMVRAILDGRKTVTRRVVKPQPQSETHPNLFITPPYNPDDILYVREAFSTGYDGDYIYKADDKLADLPSFRSSTKLMYRPSIHMPREAARIFLRVTNVRVSRLQWCGNMEAKEEGCTCCSQFARIWDSTIKPADRGLYAWEANPWVWIIEFERISKEEAIERDV